ncbi:cellulase family glycosylhydrolase [Halalkalibaculum sp. DA384]|uniref:cellulase family glycosylhydrolase n=1 Tax=Halalkalibaculum sp. DA384 TaxID=3373606 RepID=UPI003754D77C
MIKHNVILFVFGVILIPLLLSPDVTTAQEVMGEVWSEEKAQKWYDQHDWISGANFNPSTSINQIEMWQEFSFDPETIDRELGWAEDIGFNTMRVYLHYLVWARSPEGLKNRMEQFLEIADSHGIKIMFVLFDDVWGDDPNLGEQPDPVPGIHNSAWVESPGHDQRLDEALYPVLKAYTQDLISHFDGDDRVLMWDLYNEPGNGKNPPSSSLPLLKNVTAWARDVNPSQPITIGMWIWNDDFEELNRFSAANSDIITFHDYNSIDRTREVVGRLQEMYDRPMICTEYMARTNGSKFQTHFPFFAEQNIGAINWGLVSGKTQTIYSWQSPRGYGDEFYERWRGEVREVYRWEDHLQASEPEVWFHDIFRRDGSAFDTSEIELIKRINKEY